MIAGMKKMFINWQIMVIWLLLFIRGYRFAFMPGRGVCLSPPPSQKDSGVGGGGRGVSGEGEPAFINYPRCRLTVGAIFSSAKHTREDR